MFLPLITLTLPILALAAPLSRRLDTSSYCGHWDTIPAGSYTVLLDQWGTKGATGQSCAQLTSLSGSNLAWVTDWTWSGGNGIKSYTNVQLDKGVNQQLSAIKSMPSAWSWKQTTTGKVVADIAYDLFTSTSVGGSNANEIMIWLANINAGPISYNWNADGTAKPVATGVSIEGHTWDVYHGSNNANPVWSFLPTSNAQITNFSGDIYSFFKYLISKQGLPSSQYLKTAQAGTEATSGSAGLTTTRYSLAIE
ncbi:glycoside hydrolase family 12 protein [Heterobasidion irregulare TC 32-1]|uniref:Glycoside hydrolase family 12 protein n=1 Tax=Heterobasidion irregulare (strain TC 32-1) TaxID=747525 RepID=W4JQJ5_HETIT|nr:glycoside hydrolase family 12 protein [Heterobasidion irregulare TC 32-1]ETW75161.1 glycoside hydrolase family 12 protein [Heterobasidion irregulare TC 32-1]